jgi:hypothetical protein
MMLNAGSALPIELRASLDLLFELLAGSHGVMRTCTIGDPTLIAALASYGSIEPNQAHPTFLGASTGEIDATIMRLQPAQVTVFGSSAFQRLIQPLRRSVHAVMSLPEERWWEQRGYRQVKSIGIQGVGSLFWSTGDRILRMLNRPQFADRCRIAMLRTLVSAQRRLVPSTLLIRQYRRTT